MKTDITILAIDDDAQILYTFQELFRFQGWKSLSARSVEDGLMQFDQHKPHIVLINYHMPIINGVEGVRLLRLRSAVIPSLCLPLMKARRSPTRF